MRPFTIFTLAAAATLVLAASPAIADTNETVKFDPARMWECPQADGSSIYTNKERSGCKLLVLKELSVVPSLDQMPTYRSPYAATPASDMSYSMDRAPRGRQFRDGLRSGTRALPGPADRYKARFARSMANGSIWSKKPVAGFSTGRIRLTVET